VAPGVPSGGGTATLSVMPIQWDAVLAGASAAALDRVLRGARVRALHLDRDAQDVRLWLRDHLLLIRMHPSRGEIVLLPAAEPFEGATPLASRVARIRSLPDERILLIELRRVRGPGRRMLVLEWIPTRWNALLVEGEGDAPVIRQLLRSGEKGARPLLSGHPWRPPAPARRARPASERARSRLAEVADAPAGVLLSGLAWSSPLNLAALRTLPPEGAAALLRRCERVGRGEEEAEPVLLRRGDELLPYPIPLGLPGEHPFPGTLLEAFAAVAEGAAEAVPQDAGVDPILLREVERRLERASRRVAALEREWVEAPDPGPVRALGDLLLARFREVPTGTARALLEGFDGTPVEVPLDPALPVHENAARFYDEAARAERVLENLPQRIEEAGERVAALRTLRERILRGEADAPEIAALREQFREHPASGGSGGGAMAPTLPFRRYRSSGGLEIRVGRGPRHNDDLTFHHSAPGDIWLHAREVAGAHVILRWTGPGNPPARDLEEAAILAALHSKARTSGSAPVDWTLRKHVRKPRKAPPGRVIPDRVKTLFVEPDPAVEARLALAD